MRTTLILGLTLLLSGAAAAQAGHHHGRDCGHYYDRHSHRWISVNVFGPRGGFAFGYQSAPRYHFHGRNRCYRSHGRWKHDRYDRYYDNRYDRGWRGRDRYDRGHRHHKKHRRRWR